MAVVPGVKWALEYVKVDVKLKIISSLFLGYTMSLLATALGNWTRDGAGWHLNDAALVQMSFCYSTFLVGSALVAHAIYKSVVAAFDICGMGAQFAVACVLTFFSLVSYNMC